MHHLFIVAVLTIVVYVFETFYIMFYKKVPINKISLTSVMIIIIWFMFIYAFLTNDLSLRVVYENSSEGQSILSRFAGSWASGEGAFIYVAFFIAITYLFFIRDYKEKLDFVLSYISLMILLLILAIINGAFQETGFFAQSGVGLNPLLKNFWMYIHPLLSLSSYGVSIVGVLTVIKKTGTEISRNLFRLAWLLVTGAILSGAYWSYTTFGWGGYWAWDPVETVQLILWLSITFSLHSIPIGQKSFEFGSFLSGISVFLALLVTRVGISPLHGFANVKEVTGIILAIFVAYFLYKSLINIEYFINEVKNFLNNRSPFHVGVLINQIALFVIYLTLSASLLIPSILVLIGVSVTAPQTDFAIRLYHPILFPTVLMILISTLLCSLGREIRWRTTLSLITATGLISVIFVYLTLRQELLWSSHSRLLTNIFISALIPFSSLGLASVITHIIFNLRKKNYSDINFVNIVHLGVLFIIIGILLSGPFAYSKDIFRYSKLVPNQQISIQGINVELIDYDYEISSSRVQISMNDINNPIHQLAAMAQYLLATEVTQLAKIASLAEEKINRMGLGWVLQSKVDAASSIKKLECLIELPDNTTEKCFITIDISTIYPLLNLNNNELSLLLIMTANLSLESSYKVYDVIIQNGGIILSFVNDLLDITASESLIRVSKLSIIAFDFEQHVPITPIFGKEGVLLSRATVIPLDGNIIANNIEYSIPFTIDDPSLMMYYALVNNRNTAIILAILKNTGLYEKFASGVLFRDVIQTLPSNCISSANFSVECLRPFFFSLVIPESAYLSISIKTEDKVSFSKLRFDVSGEVKGIHGLVPQVILVSKGLSDHYIVVTSPQFTSEDAGFPVYYHDLMVYYLSTLINRYSTEDILRLSTLLVSGYYSGIPDINPTDIVYLSLLLYSYAINYSSMVEMKGIDIQFKIIPGVNLIWLGGIVLILGELLLMLVKFHRKKDTVTLIYK